MAAGLSDSARRSRRYRFLQDVLHRAKLAGLDAKLNANRGAVSCIITVDSVQLVFTMAFGSMSNGETTIERRLAIWNSDGVVGGEYSNWLWLERNAPAKRIFSALKGSAFRNQNSLSSAALELARQHGARA